MLMKSPQTWLICPQAPFYVNRIDWYCVGLTETTMSTSRVICMPQQRCKNAENTYLPALRGGPNLAIPLSFLLVTIECICKIWWLLLPGRIAEYRGERACLCLSVRYSISPELQCLNSTKCFVHVTYSRGSVLLWQRCDTVYTSGFVDGVMFATAICHAHIVRHCKKKIKTKILIRTLNKWRGIGNVKCKAYTVINWLNSGQHKFDSAAGEEYDHINAPGEAPDGGGLDTHTIAFLYSRWQYGILELQA